MTGGRKLRVAVVGARGAVGGEVLAELFARGYGTEQVVAVSTRQVGGTVDVGGRPLALVAFDDPDRGVTTWDEAVFADDAETARRLVPRAADCGVRVVDNSSAFRHDPEVPLVVPELPSSLATALGKRVFANPNCSTILAAVVLEPLRRRFGIREVSLSTYQAVSGAGRAAVEELREQTRRVLDGEPPLPSVFAEPCAFNVFPHESEVDPDTGANEEERKIVAELRRLWGEPDARIDPCCVRVPVERAHSQSIQVHLGRDASRDEVERALADAPGVRLCVAETVTPRRASGGDEVLVGRVRPALHALRDAAGRAGVYRLWVSGDQLRKGAALNALQILDATR